MNMWTLLISSREKAKHLLMHNDGAYNDHLGKDITVQARDCDTVRGPYGPPRCPLAPPCLPSGSSSSNAATQGVERFVQKLGVPIWNTMLTHRRVSAENDVNRFCKSISAFSHGRYSCTPFLVIVHPDLLMDLFFPPIIFVQLGHSQGIQSKKMSRRWARTWGVIQGGTVSKESTGQ